MSHKLREVFTREGRAWEIPVTVKEIRWRVVDGDPTAAEMVAVLLIGKEEDEIHLAIGGTMTLQLRPPL